MRRSPAVVLLFAGRLAVAEPALPGTRVARGDDLAQRQSIRGEALEARESPELRALRRFEEERLLPALSRPASGSEPPAGYAHLGLPDLPVRWDPRVARFLDFYTGDRRGRAIIGGWLRAQGRYRALIEEALRRHHLPHALLYVAMIESGYDPLDRSWAGASGLWQFMPAAAQIYGLRVDHWVDERNDPEKATEAQMRYFDDLKARFGSWHVALAAFNAGYGALLAAIAKYNSNDYWELCRHEDGLPWETVLYVPKVLAAAIVGENRAALGFGDLVPEAPLAYDAVTVVSSVTLDEAARAADVPVEMVVALNPELRHRRTPPGGPWRLKLPEGSGPRFLLRARTIAAGRAAQATYTVRLGDRVESIARAHDTSAAALRRLNALRDGNEVRPGLVLMVPASRGAGPAGGEGARGRGDDGVRRGANVEEVIIPVADKDASVNGRRRLFYRVAPGDGLAEVARHFHVTEDDLVRWNRLDPQARLCPGLFLQLWVAPETELSPDEGAVFDPERDPVRVVTAGSEEFLDLVELRRGRKRVAYVVRPGDTLRRVGARFGLTEGDLERINRLPRTAELHPGDTLVVYRPLAPGERVAALAGRLDASSPGPPSPPEHDPLARSDDPPAAGDAPPPDPASLAPVALPRLPELPRLPQ